MPLHGDHTEMDTALPLAEAIQLLACQEWTGIGEGELLKSGDERPVDSFAALLRLLRLEARYTQEVLAEKSGLSVRAIVDLEAGAVLRPQRRSINSLADALGLNPAQRADFADVATRDYWARRQLRELEADNHREGSRDICDPRTAVGND
jgi:transcriptional regulator with XRE-family HTH domain